MPNSEGSFKKCPPGFPYVCTSWRTGNRCTIPHLPVFVYFAHGCVTGNMTEPPAVTERRDKGKEWRWNDEKGDLSKDKVQWMQESILSIFQYFNISSNISFGIFSLSEMRERKTWKYCQGWRWKRQEEVERSMWKLEIVTRRLTWWSGNSWGRPDVITLVDNCTTIQLEASLSK